MPRGPGKNKSPSERNLTTHTARGTPRGKTGIAKPFKVDQLLKGLPTEKRQAFLDLARRGSTLGDLQRWLKEEVGDTVCASSISYWKANTFPPGEAARYFNELAEGFKGIDESAGKQWLLGKTGVMLADMYNQLQRLQVVENITEDNATALIPSITALTKEFRSLADTISREQYIKEKAELELAGAQRMADIIELNFKDTQVEQIVQDAIKGALLQIESEVRGER